MARHTSDLDPQQRDDADAPAAVPIDLIEIFDPQRV